MKSKQEFTNEMDRITNEVFDYDSYLNYQNTGSEMILVGHLVKLNDGFNLKRL